MDGDCTVYASKHGIESAGRGSSNFEVMDGLLYRRKFERGFINYREVLGEDRRQEAISTFHRRRPGQRHLSLEETYKCVAENYWWEGMLTPEQHYRNVSASLMSFFYSPSSRFLCKTNTFY